MVQFSGLITLFEYDPANERTTFTPSVYPLHLDVKAALAINSMFRALRTGKFDRLVIELDSRTHEDKREGAFAAPPFLQAFGSDIEGTAAEDFIGADHLPVLGLLADLQERTGCAIPLPLALTPAQEDLIRELHKLRETESGTTVLERLRTGAAESRLDYTTIRISEYLAGGSVLNDELIGPVRRILPRVEMTEDQSTEVVGRALAEGTQEVRIASSYSSMSVQQLRQWLLEAYSTDGLTAFWPGEPESQEPAKVRCEVVFRPLEDRLWYREQVIHFRIRDVSGLSPMLVAAREAAQRGEPARELHLLEQAVLAYPKEADLHGSLGWAYYKAGNLDKCYEHSLEATNPNRDKWALPPSVFAYFNLGLCCLEGGRFVESLSWYVRAAEFPRGPAIEEAIEDLRAVDSVTRPEALFFLAFLFEKLPDETEAVRLYGEFLSSDSPSEDLRRECHERLSGLG